MEGTILYISELAIENYRCFKKCRVSFSEGLNIIIGENNSGKTALFKAMELLFGREYRRRPTIDDFFRDPKMTELPEESPEIRVTAVLKQSSSDDVYRKALAFRWLTSFEEPLEATLTYCFHLPEADAEEFKKEVARIRGADNAISRYWNLVDRYLPKYVSRILGGNPELMNRADPDRLDRISFDFLNAVRDVDSSIVSGRNTLLNKVLSRHLDYPHNPEDENEERRREFSTISRALVDNVHNRIDHESVLSFAGRTGASMGGHPEISGTLDENDVMSIMRLVVRDMGMDIPVTHNGLGYNNLIYTALVLADIETRDGERLGENAKAFSILVMEEPEAHLHPAMQYKFVKFLGEELNGKEHRQQFFISTHSTHVTSAVSLDSIVCLARNTNGEMEAYYPGRVFSDAKEDIASKRYIERFLDATKSTLLFARGVILVEGIAEQLILPCLGDYQEKPLEDSHVAVVNVGGSTFKHFLKLFGVDVEKPRQQYALPYPVACIVDSDPLKPKEIGQGWVKCWPFEMGKDNIALCRPVSATASNLQSAVESSKCDNVRIYNAKEGKGYTFEYDLMYTNYGKCSHDVLVDVLVTEACTKRKALERIMSSEEKIDELIRDFDSKIAAAVDNSDWEDDELRAGLVAACYLTSVEKTKGEHALIVASNIREKMNQKEWLFEMVVPLHIQEAIAWVTRSAQRGGNEAYG